MLLPDRGSTPTKSDTNRDSGSGFFFDMLPTAAVLACGATLPAALGHCLGRDSVGFTASFGAYLVTITHADLPIRGRAQRLAATVLMFGVGACELICATSSTPTVDPEPAVGVQHDFGDGRIFEITRDCWPERGAQHARAASVGFRSKGDGRHVELRNVALKAMNERGH